MEEYNKYDTSVTDEEIKRGVRDEYGCVYSTDGKRLLKGNKDLLSYTVRNGVEVICDEAFVFLNHIPHGDNMAVLQSITLPNSVKVIGDSAFEFCRTLQNVVLPESLKSIGSSAFWDCESLKHIHLPNSILSIGENAFSFCKSLQSITLPEALIYIGEDAFDDCLSLRSIYIPQGKREYFEKLLLENGNEKWIKKLVLK